jgi:RND family efflux transporter MFP subunit
MKKLIWLTLLAFASCNSNETTSAEPLEEDSFEVKKPLISVLKVEKKTFKDFFKAQGSVISKKMTYVKPEINGAIEKIHVTEGEYVEKGQALFTIATDLFNAQIAEINEQISFAEYVFNKQKKMFEDGVTTELQLKEAESGLNRAKKAKNTLLTQIEKSKVLAPFGGYIEEVLIKSGEIVSPMNYLCQLINTNELYAVADVSENLLSDISEKKPLSVYFPSLDLNIENLTVSRVGKVINAINRTVKIECKLPKNNGLIPNLMAELNINHYTKDSAICLPSRLILKNSKGETFLKLVDDNNSVIIKNIVLGRNYQSEVEILSGVDEGVLIVDEGRSTVLEGQEVEVISSK